MKGIGHFIELIESITNRPSMFAVNKVEDIGLVIMGYEYASNKNENNVLLSECMIGFRDFINKKFESQNNFDWVKLIRLYSGSDLHSIQLFSQLFKEYIQDQEL